MQQLNLILAALSAGLPFVKWLKVPVVHSLPAVFGAEQSFSLFGYLFAAKSVCPIEVTWVITGLSVLALIGIICQALYVIQVMRNRGYQYAFIGAAMLLMASLLFIVTVGTFAAVFKGMTLTIAPGLTFMVAVMSLVLTYRLKQSAI